MTGIDWIHRRDTHTQKAIDAAKQIDFPLILLVIYYPSAATYEQPPCFYQLDCSGVKPTTRKRSQDFTGMKVLYMPNGDLEITYV